MEKMRLDRLLAEQSALSRKEAKSAIRQGRVFVDGLPAVDGGQAIFPSTQTVALDGLNLQYRSFVYYMINKPAGVLSASTDARRKTVVDLLRPKVTRANLFPVGRLDKDTTGLLIITDDGAFAHRVISPKSGIPKCYRVTLDGNLSQDMIARFADGIVLADGTSCKPAKLEIINSNMADLTLYEGKYHEVKRMFGVVGLGVCALKRLSIGSLILPPDLDEGNYVEMTSQQVQAAAFGQPYTFLTK